MPQRTDETDFAKYVALQRRRGLAPRDLARLLGCSPQSVENWCEHAPPPYVGLALSALEAGLNPWKAPKRRRAA
jgi:DNA-binding transcriptional regulator YiaG